MLWNIMHTK